MSELPRACEGGATDSERCGKEHVERCRACLHTTRHDVVDHPFLGFAATCSLKRTECATTASAPGPGVDALRAACTALATAAEESMDAELSDGRTTVVGRFIPAEAWAAFLAATDTTEPTEAAK